MQQKKHITELLPGYALGCLETQETAMVVEHLAVCEQCQAELEAFQRVGDQLAMAAPDAKPSPVLKRRILNHVQPDKPLQHKQPFLSDWWQRITAFFQPVGPKWAVVNMVAILLLVSTTVFFWQQTQSLEERYLAGDFQTVVLKCTHVVPEATGYIQISRDGEFGILTVAHLPVLESDHIYQIWLTRNGERTPGGRFSVNRNGYGVMKLTAPESLLDCDFSITVEPVEGSPVPTGELVLQSMV